MTSPERFRRRQRIEGTALLLLGVFTILTSLYFRHQDMRQRECFAVYVAQSSRISQIRGDIVEHESQATRKAILDALSAQTIADIKATRAKYEKSLAGIDKAREENPVHPFKEKSCG